MRLMPSAALARWVDLIVRRMEDRHPKLFKNLALLDHAVVYLEPTDLPHRFALRMGKQVGFALVDEESTIPDATISGSLQALIDMLEGREDGDALFFSRAIQVTGNTTVIVGLRNTLDREEIQIYDEVLSLCGPFAQPVGIALSALDQVARRVKARVAALHEELHAARESVNS